MNGGRAERNEYILLHEFHRLKYICPDKTWGKKTSPRIKEEFEDDGEGGGGGKKGKGKGVKAKRDKYKGGLVFEPKRGLWDRYVLVMDFNSLYPSIIQEWNIDFTTVSSIEDEEDLAVWNFLKDSSIILLTGGVFSRGRERFRNHLPMAWNRVCCLVLSPLWSVDVVRSSRS